MKKVFTHGSMVDFQPSAREMFLPDLEKLMLQMIGQHEAILFGTIDLTKEEITLFGHIKDVKADEEKGSFSFEFLPVEEQESDWISHASEDLLISHEAIFTILDENEREVKYRVLYATFLEENGEEITYYMAPDRLVSHPLACVVEFWKKVHEVGRDIDFAESGCTAHEIKNLLKKKRL
jgi:hypothetical protein